MKAKTTTIVTFDIDDVERLLLHHLNNDLAYLAVSNFNWKFDYRLNETGRYEMYIKEASIEVEDYER